MKISTKILIVDSSGIIRKGLIALLKKDDSLNPTFFESTNIDDIKGMISRYEPEILIVNPSMVTSPFLSQTRKFLEDSGIKIVAMQSTLVDPEKLSLFDEILSIYDKPEQINEKLSRMIASPKNDIHNEILSQREKEVLVGVVKGMTNKQIADSLCISLHTVITHRRNIASKLDIHSTAGLTIYAIVNNLIDL
ncbi:response regulator transcription factor [Bacteroidales bacterium OttesenSCG-928-A17]|nr:response regulator transcription factor [Bacteroidales bacterium OttesenSCG-928-A17]